MHPYRRGYDVSLTSLLDSDDDSDDGADSDDDGVCMLHVIIDQDNKLD